MGTERPSTVLLLGGSADQLFAVRTARSIGLRTVVVDMNPDSPGFTEADHHAVISTRDVTGILQYVANLRDRGEVARIDGVLVMGSDIPQVVAELAEHLGTPGIPVEAALLATDKMAMKQRFRDRGVAVPWFDEVGSTDALRCAAEERGFPLVIKPPDRSGARGVFLLRDDDELDAWFARSQDLSLVGKVMVEEYVDGPQISTESLMVDGRAHTPGFADRNYEMLDRFAPRVIENGGWVPSALSVEQRREVESLVERAALALGIENGVVKGDVVWSSRGPVMIEMAARLSGGDFSESLIPIGCGVDLVAQALRLAVGLPVDAEALQPRFQRGVVNRYFFPEPGRLVRIDGVEEIRSQPWVRKLEFWYRPGDIVPGVCSHADRFGVFIVSGETRQEAEEHAARVYESIRIVTEPV